MPAIDSLQTSSASITSRALRISAAVVFAAVVGESGKLSSAGDADISRVTLAVAIEAAQPDNAVDPAPHDLAERQRVATAMVYVVIGIAVVGIALIVLIILGGHRIRQRARARAGRAADLDPLWYLRKQPRSENAGPRSTPPAEPSRPERRDPEDPS
jgi:hypothetical protein